MRKKPSDPTTPPAHLSAEAKEWWQRLTEQYEFEDHSLLILASALEAFDRMRQAQKLIKRDGITFIDRFGQRRQHPATLVERDAKGVLLRHLKALGLDLEPLNDGPGRPGGK